MVGNRKYELCLPLLKSSTLRSLRVAWTHCGFQGVDETTHSGVSWEESLSGTATCVKKQLFYVESIN